ncbi:hypothetical protein ACFFRR_005961 [Megaselia abdita]
METICLLITFLSLYIRSFAKLNIEKKEDLSLDTFMEGIVKAGYFEMKEKEIEELFESFVGVNEFFNLLRPSMSATRINAINKAFSKLDPERNGSTDFATFKKTYIVDKHPKYQNGDYTKASIFEKILTNFENNLITKEDFLNYYSAISAQIERDIYFDLFMRECYNL